MKAAIDIGGTFTDMLAVDEHGVLTSAKLPTHPDDLCGCFHAAVRAASAGAQDAVPDELLYGTTVALNTLLEGRLPRIGLIVTRGFRQLLETARLPCADGRLPSVPRPAPERLVPLEFVSEVSARVAADGTVRAPVDDAAVTVLAHRYRDQGITVVAVSLLHSYADASHEREIAAIFAREAPGIDVVLSSDVQPELREYERTLATCLNACLMPTMRTHVKRLAEASDPVPLFMMKSSGGLSSAGSTLRKPLSTVLSGPGAAVVGMAWLGRQIGIENLITLDIGGTSTDVALVHAGRYAKTTAGEVAGFPLKIPMIDLCTIGAGGGSVAQCGSDNRWHVGPQSAGAEPGPACYGRGGSHVTLTDAQLVLGRLPDALLGGRLPLDTRAARAALAAFGAPRGIDVLSTARGILDIATHNICGAIRRVSVLRGRDPRDYALLATGGAGPLHAAELAGLLGITTVIVPPRPGLAAAYGLLVADVEEDFVRAFGRLDDAVDASEADDLFEDLDKNADRFLAREGIAAELRRARRFIDMRYTGMLYEMSIELPGGRVTRAALAQAVDAFHERFERLTGHSHRGHEAVEFINLRVAAVGERAKPALVQPLSDIGRDPRPRVTRQVAYFDHETFIDSAVFDRDSLGPGVSMHGPAVIEQYESTVIVPPGFGVEVDGFGNLILRPMGRGR